MFRMGSQMTGTGGKVKFCGQEATHCFETRAARGAGHWLAQEALPGLAGMSIYPY